MRRINRSSCKSQVRVPCPYRTTRLATLVWEQRCTPPWTLSRRCSSFAGRRPRRGRGAGAHRRRGPAHRSGANAAADAGHLGASGSGVAVHFSGNSQVPASHERPLPLPPRQHCCRRSARYDTDSVHRAQRSCSNYILVPDNRAAEEFLPYPVVASNVPRGVSLTARQLCHRHRLAPSRQLSRNRYR